MYNIPLKLLVISNYKIDKTPSKIKYIIYYDLFLITEW